MYFTKFGILTLLAGGIGFFACQPQDDFQQNQDWLKPVAGVYEGNVPCADCDGIIYKLDLQPEFQYTATFRYLGKSDEPEIEKGEFGFINDSTIVLSRSEAGLEYFEYFRVRGKGLLLLDTEAKPITGPLSGYYQLERITGKDSMSSVEASLETEGADADFLEARWEESIDFYATGNEPGWKLELDFDDTFTFTPAEGHPLIALASEREFSQTGDQYTYSASGESGEIQITITPGICTDNMSGRKEMFGVSVRVKRGEQQATERYEGCGRYIPNPVLRDIWVLESMNDESVTGDEFQKGLPTITFLPVESKINGHDGCNNYSGSFYSFSTTISLGPVVSTKMACDNMEKSDAFLKFLVGQPLAYGIEDDKLVLVSDDIGRLVLRRAD